MTKVTNLRRRGTLGVRGKHVEPGQTVEVDISQNDLKKHRFVREGWLMIGEPKPKKKGPETTEAKKSENGDEKQGE